MKRLHVNLSVEALEPSVAFYSKLFAAPPTVQKPDYAKWMLDDPRVNFSLSSRQHGKGIDHLGIEAADAGEFDDLRERLRAADAAVFDQPDTQCCYARSTKAWIRDPNGVAWETFLTHGEVDVYGDGTSGFVGEEAVTASPQAETRCCG